MGKLIRNGIEYGGGNGTDIFEVTQAEYDALVQAGTLVHNALYVITDAPNLNETAKQISYDGGTDTVWDNVEKAHSFKQLYSKSTYQNDIGETITLSETSANFRFLRISLYINDMGYSNAGMLLLANIKGGIQIQHFPLCINANLGSVHLDLSGTSLKLYSTSFGSTMFVYQVVGIY